MDAAQEVKSRLNIEDVIAGYVQLKRMGRNYKGLSPWTNEKTASFVVSPEKQIWHDFSSGRGGDVISFVMEVEGLDFRGALEQLARKAGVDLEQFGGQGNQENAQRKKKATEILSLSAKFYQKQLIASKPALEYLLKKREFTKQTLIDWQLGYSPNTGQALVNFLTKRGYKPNEIKEAGLSSQRGGDMFRGRIMIPLCDARGSIIGFTARILADDPDAPKYINTPQTVVYDKSRNVFGLHLAKESIRKTGYVVVAEGNLDVIQSHQAGVANVVASAGTAMTEQHLRELKRFTGDVRLSFDADRAGIAATERVIPIAQKTEVDLRIISLPEGQDPDDLIKKDVKQWTAAIEKAQEAPAWLIEKYETSLDLTTAAGKRVFTDALVGTIKSLRDPIEQEHYLKQIASLTDSSLQAVQAKMGKGVVEAPALKLKKPTPDSESDEKTSREHQKLQDHFLAMLLLQPKLRDLLKGLEQDMFTSDPARKLFTFIKNNPEFNGDDKEAKQLKDIGDYVKIMSLQFEELYASLSYDDLKEQAQSLKQRLISRYVKMQNIKLAAAMQNTTDESELNKLMREADKLNQTLNS
jgi:DNA primase